MYVSKMDDTINKINMNTQNKLCLTISLFIFSFLLSCIIDLYTFIPLTASAIVQGIVIISFRSIEDIEKIIPSPVPNTNIIAETVYPKQNPLKHTIR